MMPNVKTLLETLPQRGRLEHIVLRPEKREPPRQVARTRALPGRGLEGDHRSARLSNSARQVTLIQHEHLAVIASLTGAKVSPEALRRNLVVSGINLLALKDRAFRIGGATFKGAGLSQPCSRMEEALGEGGYNAVRGHGGILARVVTEGEIAVGDVLEPL